VSRALDVSGLPSYRFSHHSLMWWGVMGMIAIEATTLALASAAYLYVWSQASVWPPSPPPALFWGTLNVAVLLASILPNHWAKRAAEDGDERRMRLWLVVCSAIGVAMLAIRALEFSALNVRWDSNAYGSAAWFLLGLHTAHLATDVYDTLVLTILMFTGPLEGRRHVDVAENGVFWYFVVYAWLPVYAVIYWLPRLS
jgi:cytochrome c oxidase subunit III